MKSKFVLFILILAFFAFGSNEVRAQGFGCDTGPCGGYGSFVVHGSTGGYPYYPVYISGAAYFSLGNYFTGG
ncbi:MAG: hypothetical protein ACKOW9_03820, partial [Candidatus Paceibacterota bacterium]